jgi:hypothetical protein
MDGYGAFGGQSESSSTSPLSNNTPSGESGRYSDFTGSSFGSSDPLGAGGYGEQAPSAGSGYYGSEQNYGQHPPAPSAPPSPPSTQNPPNGSFGSAYDTGENPRRTPEEWDNYRGDFRR